MKISVRIFAAVTAATFVACASAAPPDLGVDASLHAKQVLPRDDLWNQDIFSAPVDPHSAAIIAKIGAHRPLHPDFGTVYNGAPNGIPYIVVRGDTKKQIVSFVEYGNESDNAPYPIPPDAPIEGAGAGDGDRHVLVIDRDNWMLYELWHARLVNAGAVDGAKHWEAGSGAIFNLANGTTRPAGWTSADAAGLPIFPGLVRYDEVMDRGEITHALRFTVRRSRKAYVAPARHFASNLTDPALPPMGMRLRLRSDFDLAGFSVPAQVILKALKRYGMILADNGSDLFLSGSPDSRWNDDDLAQLSRVKGSDLEVVRMGEIVDR